MIEVERQDERRDERVKQRVKSEVTCRSCVVAQPRSTEESNNEYHSVAVMKDGKGIEGQAASMKG